MVADQDEKRKMRTGMSGKIDFERGEHFMNSGSTNVLT